MASDSHFRSKLVFFKNIGSHCTILLIVFPSNHLERPVNDKSILTPFLANNAQNKTVHQYTQIDFESIPRVRKLEKFKDNKKYGTDKNNDKNLRM